MIITRGIKMKIRLHHKIKDRNTTEKQAMIFVEKPMEVAHHNNAGKGYGMLKK